MKAGKVVCQGVDQLLAGTYQGLVFHVWATTLRTRWGGSFCWLHSFAGLRLAPPRGVHGGPYVLPSHPVRSYLGEVSHHAGFTALPGCGWPSF